MNRGFKTYFKESVKTSIKTLSKKENYLKFYLHFLLSFLGKILFMVLAPIFFLSDVRMVRQSVKEKKITVSKTFQTGDNPKSYWTCLLTLIIYILLFFGGIILIGIGYALINVIIYFILDIIGSVEIFTTFLVIVGIPFGIGLLVYIFMFIMYLSPTLYIVDSTDNIGASDVVFKAINSMKQNGKGTLVLNFLVNYGIRLAYLLFAGAISLIFIILYSNATEYETQLVLYYLIYGVIGFFVLVFLYIYPYFRLSFKSFNVMLFDDVILDMYNANKVVKGINITDSSIPTYTYDTPEDALKDLFNETKNIDNPLFIKQKPVVVDGVKGVKEYQISLDESIKSLIDFNNKEEDEEEKEDEVSSQENNEENNEITIDENIPSVEEILKENNVDTTLPEEEKVQEEKVVEISDVEKDKPTDKIVDLFTKSDEEGLFDDDINKDYSKNEVESNPSLEHKVTKEEVPHVEEAQQDENILHTEEENKEEFKEEKIEENSTSLNELAQENVEENKEDLENIPSNEEKEDEFLEEKIDEVPSLFNKPLNEEKEETSFDNIPSNEEKEDEFLEEKIEENPSLFNEPIEPSVKEEIFEEDSEKELPHEEKKEETFSFFSKAFSTNENEEVDEEDEETVKEENKVPFTFSSAFSSDNDENEEEFVEPEEKETKTKKTTKTTKSTTTKKASTKTGTKKTTTKKVKETKEENL